jgi:hypothetical protein
MIRHLSRSHDGSAFARNRMVVGGFRHILIVDEEGSARGAPSGFLQATDTAHGEGVAVQSMGSLL